jgi:hypothetical protein
MDERAERQKDKPDPTAPARFFAKVIKTDTCWLFTGHLDVNGYGRFYYQGNRNGFAHRVSWDLAGRALPPGLVLDHICKRKACVNPEHLRAVTQEDNCTIFARPTPFYRNKLVTHCPQGHPYSPENTARPPDKRRKNGKRGRICLTCHPTYWRFAEVPRPRPPGSRVKAGDPDYQP